MSINQSLLFNTKDELDGLSMRFSVCPSELPVIAETCSQGVQADLMAVDDMAAKDRRIEELVNELEVRNKLIEDLERTMNQSKSKASDAEKL